MNSTFIVGESIDLCVPQEGDFEVWSSWFNSPKNTVFLEQGKFPNTVSMQRDFYQNAVLTGRFLSMIKTKKSVTLGVISLSEINYEKSSCQIALVCPEKSDDAPLGPLEAMALATEHAFHRLGVKRVWAGQAYPGLKKWTKKLELIGFKAEGFARSGFRHGSYVSDAINIAVTFEDFERLSSKRGLHLWPGAEKAAAILGEIEQEDGGAEALHATMRTIQKARDERLAMIESKFSDLVSSSSEKTSK